VLVEVVVVEHVVEVVVVEHVVEVVVVEHVVEVVGVEHVADEHVAEVVEGVANTSNFINWRWVCSYNLSL